MKDDRRPTAPNPQPPTAKPGPATATLTAAPARVWTRWSGWLRERSRVTLQALGIVLVAGFVAAAGALLLFVWLADEASERPSLWIEQEVLVGLHSHASPGLDQVALAVSLLGSQALAVLLMVALGWLAWRRRFGAAASLLVAVLGAQLLNSLLKLFFQRPRPAPAVSSLPGQSWSFPSGHAMVSLAFYGFLAYLGWRFLRGRWRALWVAAMVLLVILIGLSRMYLGVHYFTDVLAGYEAGFIWLEGVILAERVLRRVPRSTLHVSLVERGT